METKSCCGSEIPIPKKEFEIIQIEKTQNECSICEDFAASQIKKNDLVAVMSCEGACLRGDISRRVANDICFKIAPEQTARVCLGGAFTKNTGQRNMVKNANRVIALEGCVIECATRMMKGVISDLNPEIIIVDKYYKFNRSLFGINQVSEKELQDFSNEASANIVKLLKLQ